jgi:hypothetical protein
MRKIESFISDEELAIVLWDYDEYTYDNLPSWIRQELQYRRMLSRQPTKSEMNEAEADAKHHRITHNERNIQDFKDKYLKQKETNNV